MVLVSKFSLFGALLALSSIAVGADLVKDDLDPQEVLTLAPGYLVPNTTEQCPGHGSDRFQEGEEPELINSNPLAFANLIKRAGCTFYRSGQARTCVTVDNICCVDPTNAQDGWCCAGTAGCGPGTGSLGRCTTKISWTTLVSTVTLSTSVYSTVTTSVIRSTVTTTLVSTSVIVTSRDDVDTLTEWKTSTTTLAAAKARRTADPTPTRISDTGAVPAHTSSVPLETSRPETQHVELRAAVTQAPRIVQVRGQIFKRQVRTDTSTTTVTRTTYLTSSIFVTSSAFITATSTAYSTTYTTRTTARSARTTVTSTLVLTMRAGQTVPINPIGQSTDPPAAGGGGGNGNGGGGGSSGLSTGAKAGIGVGAGAGSLIICLIIGFFLIRRKKSKKLEANQMAPGAAVAAAAANSNNGPHPHDSKQPTFYGSAPMTPGSQYPPNPNMVDPRYSQTPIQYANTPSPAPQYAYQHQHPNTNYEMSATPAPMPIYPVQQHGSPSPQQPLQQHGGYQYPRPPSPSSSPNMAPGSPAGSAGYHGYQHAQNGSAPVEMASPGQVYGHPAPSEMPAGAGNGYGGNVQPVMPQPQYPGQPVYAPQGGR